MIAVVTDSSSQLTPAEANAANISVVPILVRIDDREFREGVDLSAADFYSRIAKGVRLSTSQPPPGAFVDLYESLIANGATEIVSVHLSEESSGTINSARIAADAVEVPVRLVDSKMTSYGLGVLALRLAELVAAHKSTDNLSDFVAKFVPRIGTVFILQDLDYVLRGGKMRSPVLPTGVDDVPVLGGFGGGYELITTGRTIDALIDSMARFLLAGKYRRHVAVALAAPDTEEFTVGLELRMRNSALVESVHRYQMGPSVAVYTGPGTAGGFHWPAT